MSLAERPKVGKLTVPYIVDEEREPIDFKIMDMAHVARCAEQGRCGICGGKIRRGPIAFIGPEDEDDRTCFADPWMHPACARLAMEQCPFLNQRRGWRDRDAAEEKSLVAVYERNMVIVTATSWRSHQDVMGRWHFEAVSPLTRAG